eukprot:4735735-Amphidinium_carterae.1
MADQSATNGASFPPCSFFFCAVSADHMTTAMKLSTRMSTTWNHDCQSWCCVSDAIQKKRLCLCTPQHRFGTPAR